MNGENLVVEYALSGSAYQIIDIFCPDEPIADPYPNRNYNIYPGTDVDNDGDADLCQSFDKNFVGASGNVLTYEILGFLA